MPLALLLAERGDFGRLNLQINELEQRRRPAPSPSTSGAITTFNRRKFVQARHVLVPLQAEVAGNRTLKAKVNVLLARCYAELNEPELRGRR